MHRFLSLALLASVTAPLSAQLGYDPHHSPFTPIDHGSWLEAYGGRLLGNGGPIPLGPRDGNIYGLRVDFRGQHPLQISLGGWLATAERNVIDANDSVATRIKPTGQRIFAIEANFQFNITGGKTWHHLAPYIGLSGGLAMGQKAPASDSSGYVFGSKTYFAPVIGTRYFVSERLFVKAEATNIFWKIKYPASYSAEPVKEPGDAGHPNAVNIRGKGSDYVLAPKLQFGIGWAF